MIEKPSIKYTKTSKNSFILETFDKGVSYKVSFGFDLVQVTLVKENKDVIIITVENYSKYYAQGYKYISWVMNYDTGQRCFPTSEPTCDDNITNLAKKLFDKALEKVKFKEYYKPNNQKPKGILDDWKP
jgi:hypothetical protein